jgi:two-component system phosphate regulon sensor histidine kinase PhoR
MNNQVERVLQMAQIEKQELELRKETVDLHQLIDHAIEQLRIQVESRNGTLTKDLLANNSMVFGDPVHLSNIIFNLLDNANKYSVDRPVIHIETVADSTGISVRVKDQGIGMTRETQKRIFEKFYRVPTGNIHNIKGFGLGLSYVDIILKKHNGWIQVQSEPGKGSTFEFHVPLSTSL